MFLVNGFQAKLIQYNRNGKSLAYDDEDTQLIQSQGRQAVIWFVER